MKKNRVICIALIILLLCCNIKISLAGVEEGTFGVDEFQYDLEIIKTANNYLLDSEGRLWKTSRAGLTHMFKDLTFSDIDTNNVAGHFLALDTEGYLWSWGKNTYGQLGIGSTEDSDIPVGVYQTKKFSSISAGSTSSYAIDIDGNLYAWGSNKFKQVGGSNSSYEYSDSVSIPIQLSPRKLLDGYKFQKVAAGNDNVIMLDTDGYVWGLGYDNDYDVGSSNRTKVYYDIGWNGNYWYAITTPTKISDTNTYKDISKGIQHSIMISTEGKVYTLGDGDYGQLGNGSLVDYIATPTIPLGFEDVIIKDIAAGEKTSAFLDENNTLWMTGDNSYGTLGNGTKTDTSTAIKLRGLNVESISLEHYYQKIFVNDIEGNLWGWGTNLAYDIGVSDDLYENGGSTIMTTSPLQITAKRIYYTVTFMDGTTTVDTQTVTKGESATAPNLTKTGYTLSWDTDFSNVTSDLIVNAIWTANTNTPYKVEHYQRTTDLEVEGYTLFETENKTGTTDAMAVAVAKSYSGFTENTTHTNRVATGTVVGDGSLVLKLYYDRNSYTVTLNTNGGTVNSGNVTSYTYGIGLTLPTDVTKTGYTFNGWYENSSFSGSAVTGISTTDIGNKTYYAKWTGSSNIAYKIEHYKQNVSLSGYTLEDIENKTGTTGETVTATAKSYTRFSENTTYTGRVATGTVAGDGSLVLKLYYDRNSYTVTLNTNGGTVNSGNVTSYTYGVGVTLPTNVTKIGYTFNGWYENSSLTGTAVTSISTTDTGNKTYYAKWTTNQYTVTFKNGNITEKTEIVNYGSSATAPSLIKAGYTLSWDKNFNNVTSDLTVNAIWTANTNTPYKVEHYQRTTDLEVEGYSLFETENKTGTTDTTVTAAAKTYTGFTENTTYSGRVVTGTIAGDGSLVLKLYYDRNTYNITYNLNGGTQVNTLTPTYIYGKELILSNKVEKQGYTFAGWYDNANLTGTAVTKISSTETGDKAFYAKWVKEDEYNITLNKYEIQDSYITKVSSDTSVDTFLSNINTNGIPKVFDTQGNEITGSTLVGTGSVLKVEFNGTKHEYVIAVRGDIDGNGKITVTDLSMLNQQIVKKITLTGAREKAADIDYSGKTTVTDLSMMNQALVGKIKL